MLSNLIKAKRLQMKNLLNEVNDLCRLQSYIESNTLVYLVREISSNLDNNVIAYLTGDYIALYDEFELQAIIQTIDFSENYVTKLSQEDVLGIINNLLDDDGGDLSDEELLDDELLEDCEEY